MLQCDDFRSMNNGVYQRFDKALLNTFGQGYTKENSASSKRALLLLHGFTSSPAVYRNFFEKLPPYDFISAPVLAGHGQNLDVFARSTAQAWLKSGEDALHILTKEYDEVDILGLSLGGFIAFNIARRFPVRKVFLLAPALFLKGNIDRTQKMVRICRRLGFTHLRAMAGNLQSPSAAEIAYRQLPLACIQEIFTAIASADLSIPDRDITLFLGRHDEVVHSEHVAALFKHHSKTKTIWLEKSAHVLPLDLDHPSITAELVTQF